MSISDKEYYQLVIRIKIKATKHSTSFFTLLSLQTLLYFLILQTVSIGKALYGMESPLKLKHARAAIIGTFHTQGAHSFWAITLRQPLQVDSINRNI